MDQAPNLAPDLRWIDRHLRRIKRAMLAGSWGFFGSGCLSLVIGLALAIALGNATGEVWVGLAVFAVGGIATAWFWDRVRANENRMAPWRIGEPILAILPDQVETPEREGEPAERAVLLINANAEIASDPEEMLDLRDHVLDYIASLEDEGELQPGAMPNAQQWLELALEEPDGVPPLRVNAEVSGDQSTWLVSVPFSADTDLPPTGDDGVLLVAVLRARPGKKATLEAMGDAYKTFRRFSNPINAAVMETLENAIRRPSETREARTHRYPYPRVRVIPAAFWNENLHTQSRLPGIGT